MTIIENPHESSSFEVKYWQRKTKNRISFWIDIILSLLIFILFPIFLQSINPFIDTFRFFIGFVGLLCISILIFSLIFPLARGHIKIANRQLIFRGHGLVDPIYMKKAILSLEEPIRIIHFEKEQIMYIRPEKVTNCEVLSYRDLTKAQQNILLSILKSYPNIIFEVQ